MKSYEDPALAYSCDIERVLEEVTRQRDELAAALREVLGMLPDLWGDDVVDGLVPLMVNEDAIHDAQSALAKVGG